MGLPMELALIVAPLVAAIGALICGWFCVRLSGVYLAMLTLAFAQIVWSVTFQWDEFTGGSNGLTGVWPADWLADKQAYYYLTLAATTAAVLMLWRLLHAPFGYAMRAGRDSPLRADAIGINVAGVQWVAFIAAGLFAGLAGALFAFSKGSISPEGMGVGKSVDGLGHGAAGRAADGDRAACRRRHLHVAAGHGRAQHRLLAGAAGRDDPAPRAGFPDGHRRIRRPALPKGAGCMTALLQVRDLGKSFGGNRAVDGISFSLAAGELLALIGPNGAGKTTTFNMVNGQLPADSGSIQLAGHELRGRKPRDIWRLGVGRTFQIAATFASLTVIENVQLALLSADHKVFSMWRRAANHKRDQALALLDQVGMAAQADRPCSVLAYGDVKRVELAIALANAPKLLLMDEPTAGWPPANATSSWH
jgi:ABC-type branched-subunit amino acid transport system ATPase component